MQERAEREGVAAPRVRGLMTASYVLLGLEHDDAFIQRVFQGVLQMRESSTYQAILCEGREEGRGEGRVMEARALLLRQGEKRFGAPDAPTRAALEAMTDLARLEDLSLRLLEVESWAELLS